MLSPALPISWFSVKVNNRDDKYLFSLDPIDQSIRESLQEIPPVFTFID